MNLKILSLQTKHVIENIEWIEVNTERGNYVIQKNHVPGIFILKEKKPLIYLQNAIQVILPIDHGALLELTHNYATVLLFNQS